MRVLLLGDAKGNSGPSNVHKAFLEYWPDGDEIDFVRAQDKFGFICEGLNKGLKADVVLSPLMNLPCILVQDVLHALGKPVVCFNHGYVPYENEINSLGHSRWWLDRYVAALRSADRIVANSDFQRNFILRFQPQLEDRIDHITLGVDRFEIKQSNPCVAKPVVTVAGGNRYVKGNDIVARAVALLSSEGNDLEFRVYGRSYESGIELFRSLPKGFGEDCMRGHIDREAFCNSLNQSSLFVMNSRHDSFGLSLFDALKEGCSVLTSRQCGALELLQVESCDVVEDCEDVQEVAQKIEYLLDHPNANRLYESIDFGKTGWNKQVIKLREICRQAIECK